MTPQTKADEMRRWLDTRFHPSHPENHREEFEAALVEAREQERARIVDAMVKHIARTPSARGLPKWQRAILAEPKQ